MPPPPSPVVPASPRAAPIELGPSLGTGGAGAVRLARTTREPHQWFAIKVTGAPRVAPRLDVRVDPPAAPSAGRATCDPRDPLDHELACLCLVDDPHVVRPLGRVELPSGPALALEYVHGVSLALLLDASARARASLPVGVVVRVVLDVLAGLAAIHRARVDGRALLHGDVTPRNVLVGADGRARLCDLGLSSLAGESSATLRGTPAYAAPEAVRGEPVGPAADVFATGVVLWECLRMRRLFRGANEAATLLLVEAAAAPALDEARPDLRAIAPVATRALARRPADRFDAAETFAQALRAAAPPAPHAEVALVVEALAGEVLRARLAAWGDVAFDLYAATEMK